MTTRRKFIKNSLISGVSFFFMPSYSENIYQRYQFSGLKKVDYYLTRDIPAKLFDGKRCWVHPRAGIIPKADHNRLPRVVMTMSTSELSGSDVFKAMYGFFTNSLGKGWADPHTLWTKPHKLRSLSSRYEVINGIKHPVAPSDFWPSYHKATQTLLGIGHTVVYTPEWKVKTPRPRHTSFSLYNANKNQWSVWQKMEMPNQKKFYDAGAGSVQRFDKEDGSILLPIYYKSPNKNHKVTVARCSFDGKRLCYLEHGSELGIDDNTRGLVEPSITRYKEEYFMTIRNDKKGFVTRSRDGLHFDPIQTWKFDDGTDLGSYNTQQHWVTHSNGLFLVYTRRGANNDNVFRNRAPLFMAQIDPKHLCVLRGTERILVPNRGARLGNFGVTDVGPDETWVTVGEWMQPKGVEKYGSDGSIWVARIHWKKPNLYFKY